MKRLNTLMTVFATLIMATLPVSYAMAQGSQLPYSPSDEAMMEGMPEAATSSNPAVAASPANDYNVTPPYQTTIEGSQAGVLATGGRATGGNPAIEQNVGTPLQAFPAPNDPKDMAHSGDVAPCETIEQTHLGVLSTSERVTGDMGVRSAMQGSDYCSLDNTRHAGKPGYAANIESSQNFTAGFNQGYNSGYDAAQSGQVSESGPTAMGVAPSFPEAAGGSDFSAGYNAGYQQGFHDRQNNLGFNANLYPENRWR